MGTLSTHKDHAGQMGRLILAVLFFVLRSVLILEGGNLLGRSSRRVGSVVHPFQTHPPVAPRLWFPDPQQRGQRGRVGRMTRSNKKSMENYTTMIRIPRRTRRPVAAIALSHKSQNRQIITSAHANQHTKTRSWNLFQHNRTPTRSLV